MSAQQVFPHPCNQCGLCCIAMPCPAELFHFGPRKPGGQCPALSWEGAKANCGLIRVYGPEAMGTGTGCCMKATVFVGNKPFDFASLPGAMKIAAAQQARHETEKR